MTVPETWDFPLQTEKLLGLEAEQRDRQFREFVSDLVRMYDVLADGINGNIRSYADPTPLTWTPTLNGSTAGTFTYNHQVGWIWRAGLFVELWFDVSWSAKDGTVAGDLYLELPYEVATSDQKPFVGVVQPSSVTYTGGADLVINAIPDTYRGEFWYTGTGVATAKQQVVASGQLIGHIRYIGKQNE